MISSTVFHEKLRVNVLKESLGYMNIFLIMTYKWSLNVIYHMIYVLNFTYPIVIMKVDRWMDLQCEQFFIIGTGYSKETFCSKNSGQAFIRGHSTYICLNLKCGRHYYNAVQPNSLMCDKRKGQDIANSLHWAGQDLECHRFPKFCQNTTISYTDFLEQIPSKIEDSIYWHYHLSSFPITLTISLGT